MADVPIIDTHQHLWDLSRFRLAWIEPGSSLNRDYLMKDYLAEVDGLGVVKTIYMEVDLDPSQQAAEAEYVIDLCRRDDNPMAGAVISGRPAAPEFPAYLDRFAASHSIRGIRQVIHGADTPPGYCLQPAFIEGIRLVGRHKRTFDICIRAEELPDAAKLADLCPETQFILDHCGNPNVQSPDLSAWRSDIVELARHPNVVCKISGIVASARPYAWTPDDLAPIVNHCVESFGIDRVLFGGDWPVCTQAALLGQWIQALREIAHPWPESDQRKLFHDNALGVYGLA